ncbi:MAG: pseudaminic acid synthase [Deltaproteobacteria bacterium]|nr:MAG: pseudaminic acid synthase [Deltaproteobacteria bacterium]
MDHEHVFAHRVNIGGRWIGRSEPPFVIAEMSGNHNQSLGRALKIVDAAAKAGAHALKLQTYTADSMTLDLQENEFLISDPESPWYGRSLHDLYQEAATPWSWHEPIMRRCRELGLLCFSTPFDAQAVDFLENLEVPAYKIASFENVDLPLIQKAASTGKPLIISTGMAAVSELDEAVRCVREAGCRELILLKCTSSYPASPVESNLLTIPHLGQLFDCLVGLSDHTRGIGVAVAGVSLGAVVVEKHFTLCRDDGGVDALFSLEPDEMSLLVAEVERAWQSLGRVSYGPTAKEKKSLVFRRSLYITRDLKQGDALDRHNLRAIRPGLGLPPKFYDQLLGRKVNRDVKKGTPASWDLLG